MSYKYFETSLNAVLAHEFEDADVNKLYEDPTTKKKLRKEAFKTLQNTAIEMISNLATLTTDKVDLKTKILANLFYWKDHQGKHYGPRLLRNI